MKAVRKAIAILILVLTAFTISADALIDAIDNDQTRLALELIGKGANASAIQNNRSALQRAIGRNQEDVALSLIENGADVNYKGNYNSPLNIAINNSKTKIALSLIEHGATIAIEDINDAIYEKLDSVASAMIQKYTSLNPNTVAQYLVASWNSYQSRSYLEAAIENKMTLTALVLLERGADPNYKYYYSKPPLYNALSNNLESVALALIEKGADVNYYAATLKVDRKG